MRVGIVALLQESNTFLAERTTLEHFRSNVLATGQEVAQQFAGTHHEVAGFFASLAATDIEPVPIFAARAVPFGVIAGETWHELMSILWRRSTMPDRSTECWSHPRGHGQRAGTGRRRLLAERAARGSGRRCRSSALSIITPTCRSGWWTPATLWWPTGPIPTLINSPVGCGPPI